MIVLPVSTATDITRQVEDNTLDDLKTGSFFELIVFIVK
jgi:hypothetical protein